jgi:hypothetical protein
VKDVRHSTTDSVRIIGSEPLAAQADEIRACPVLDISLLHTFTSFSILRYLRV